MSQIDLPRPHHLDAITSERLDGFHWNLQLMPPGSAKSTYGYINSDFWGAFVATPASAGIWYAWVEGTDGSAPTVYPVAFTVT